MMIVFIWRAYPVVLELLREPLRIVGSGVCPDGTLLLLLLDRYHGSLVLLFEIQEAMLCNVLSTDKHHDAKRQRALCIQCGGGRGYASAVQPCRSSLYARVKAHAEDDGLSSIGSDR